jgi:hypothetical protein
MDFDTYCALIADILAGEYSWNEFHADDILCNEDRGVRECWEMDTHPRDVARQLHRLK